MKKEENKTGSRFRNVFLHLRLPFSYFLLPIFIFSLSQSVHVDFTNTLTIFIALHFFIYPASNAYNSFMDRDTGSIGALKNPPPVTKDLYKTSVVLDILGMLLMLILDQKMILLIAVYIGVSKAYSWKGVRLKKYPVTGWLAVIIFQGAYTFLLVSMASENNFTWSWFTLQKEEGMLLSTLLIGAYYPLTQIYQHDEDSIRGDFTISYRLGIKGTFIFSAILFSFSFFLAYHYFIKYFNMNHFIVFGISLLPAIVYFFYWFIKTCRKRVYADFSHTMFMTTISSTCLIIGFTILLYLNLIK